MRRNDKGIAVPGESPAPYGYCAYGDGSWFLVDANGLPLIDEDGCYFCKETEAFIRHAANFHERLADIVRRMAEWHDQEDDTIDILPIMTDAAALWEVTRKDGE